MSSLPEATRHRLTIPMETNSEKRGFSANASPIILLMPLLKPVVIIHDFVDSHTFARPFFISFFVLLAKFNLWLPNNRGIYIRFTLETILFSIKLPPVIDNISLGFSKFHLSLSCISNRIFFGFVSSLAIIYWKKMYEV